MSETRVVHVNDRIEGAVYIGRAVPRKGIPHGSIFANPFPLGSNRSVEWRAAVIEKYRVWIIGSPGILRVLPSLRGKPLACWCRYDGTPRSAKNTCHGDILIELLDRYTDDELRAMGGGS